MGANPNNFIQKVFDEISLEKNMDLWMSTEDSLLQERLEFLSTYPQTLFQDQLFNPDKKSNIAKNSKLCQGFKGKAQKFMEKQDFKPALNVLNMSLMLSEPEDESEILLLRY